jgi:hypothetical protein
METEKNLKWTAAAYRRSASFARLLKLFTLLEVVA